MGKKLQRDTTPPGPRHAEVERFKLLMLYAAAVELLFFIAFFYGIVGPALAAAIILLVHIVFGVPYTFAVEGGEWVVVALVLVGPLYYLRKSVRQRLSEAQSQLEHIAPPDSSREGQA